MEARNPAWGDPGHTAILLEASIDGDWVPFVARLSDPESSDVFVRARNGDYGTVADYVAPAPTMLRFVDKMTMIERLTSDESDQLQAALDQAPGYLQLLYGSVMRIDTQSPYYQTLHDTIAATLGSSARADEILMPTE